MADQKDTASVAESKSPEQQRAAFFQTVMLDEVALPALASGADQQEIVGWLWVMVYETGEKVTRLDVRSPEFFRARLDNDFTPWGRAGRDYDASFEVYALPVAVATKHS